MSEEVNKLYEEALGLLKELIAIPSFSREEQGPRVRWRGSLL